MEAAKYSMNATRVTNRSVHKQASNMQASSALVLQTTHITVAEALLHKGHQVKSLSRSVSCAQPATLCWTAIKIAGEKSVLRLGTSLPSTEKSVPRGTKSVPLVTESVPRGTSCHRFCAEGF